MRRCQDAAANGGYGRAVVAAAVLAAAMSAMPANPAHAQRAEAAGKTQLLVSVPDSSAAAERFALADKLERAREWSKSAEVYQELLDQYRDRVVPAGDGPEDAGLYISVAKRATRQLAEWPAEGLAIYNGRYQPAAEGQLQAATSATALRAVFERYGLTRAGQMAARRLLQMQWDAGELASAAHLAESMAGLLPESAAQKPELLMQAGAAWHISGNSERARELLEVLKKDYPEATALVAGEEKPVAAVLEASLAAAVPGEAAAGSWPAYGGSADRASIAGFQGRSDALLFSVDTASVGRAGEGAAQMRSSQLRMMLNQTLAIYPVYDQRQLFFQDGVNLHALSIDGGMKLPGWQSASVPLAPRGMGAPMLRTLALTPDAVYAVVADAASAMPGMPDTGPDNSAVVCVNRESGETLWRTSPATIAQQTPVLKSTRFASPPLVVGDQLFVASRGGQNGQFHDIYVLCFDRHNGALLWSSYVASGPNLSLMMMDDMPFSVESGLPQLSAHAGRVIIATNLGVIAAIEASDGTPAWLRTYPRVDMPANPGAMMGRVMMRPGMAQPAVARIFAASPAIISAGNVFVLPVDGKAIQVLSERDGRVVKQIPRGSLGSIDTLVGMIGEKMIVAGEHVATVVDWRKAHEKSEAQSEAIEWSMDFPSNALRGRPFLTADSFFLPTDDRLLRITTDKWKIEQATPPYPGTWAAAEGPGNVLATDEHVVIATGKRVNVYTNLSAATGRLDREVAAAPGSVGPLVRYGELLFAAGQYPAAVEKLRAGLAMAKGASSQAADRERLFSVALTCAVRLATQDAKSQHWRTFFELAKDAAGSPAQQVQYHFSAATMYLRDNNGSASLSELQAILDDPQQRVVSYRDTDGSSRGSAEIARRQIAQLIDRYGTSVYQEIEQRAKDSLTKAQGEKDIAALVDIGRRYPNSAAAALGLHAAAQVQESQGDFVNASSTLRELVQAYSTHTDIAAFVESLARVYAAIPGKANVAAARLSQAAVAYNNPSTRGPIRLPSGQVIQAGAFLDVADALRAAAAGVQPARPLPNFALPAMGGSPFGEPVDLKVGAELVLAPAAGAAADFTRTVVMLAGGDIAVIDNKGKAMATFAAPKIAAPKEYLWVGPAKVVVKNNKELLALDVDGAKVAWRVVPEQLPDVQEVNGASAVEATASEEDAAPAVPVINPAPWGLVGPNLRRIAPAGGAPEPPVDGITDIRCVAGKVIFSTSSGRLAAVDAETGKLLWQIRLTAANMSRITCSDDFTAVKCNAPGKSTLLCVDNATGRIVHTRNFANDALQNLLLTGDGQLVYTLPNQIVSRDLFDQGDRVIFETTMSDAMTFLGQDQQDQLVLVNDAIVATANRGMSVRMFSRYSGKQIMPGGREATTAAAATLPQQGRTSRTHLMPTDPYVYAFNQQAIRAVNVQRSESPERRLPAEVINLKSVMAGTRHLVAFEQPLRLAEAPTVSEITFFAFSRAAGSSGESGRLDHMVKIKQPAGISSWQMVEGGLFIATGEKRLLFYPCGQ